MSKATKFKLRDYQQKASDAAVSFFNDERAKYNSIVAECKKTGERQVATTPLHCLYFEQKKGDAEIHPMLCYDKDR